MEGGWVAIDFRKKIRVVVLKKIENHRGKSCVIRDVRRNVREQNITYLTYVTRNYAFTLNGKKNKNKNEYLLLLLLSRLGV